MFRLMMSLCHLNIVKLTLCKIKDFLKKDRALLTSLEEITAYPITERSQMFYVEVIRNLSEFVVYGEKYLRDTTDSNYFDIICERNILEQFSSILQMDNRFVNMQLIQTSSIFLYNIKQ